ncbi:MAG: hypothetical protein WC665_11590 [Sulfurimonas sp.]|jgi:hypothetical protein
MSNNYIDDDLVSDEEEQDDAVAYDYLNEKPIDEDDYEDEDGYEYEENDDRFCD